MSDQLDLNRIPRHIAIIMDGNGRWAKARGLERTAGHQQGVVQVRQVMEEAVSLGVEYLTLYTFSTENWNRPSDEVAALMALLLKNLADEEVFTTSRAKFNVIGDVDRLPQIVIDALNHMIDFTKDHEKTCMTIALSYSSRWELTKAMKDIATKVSNGELKAEDVTEEVINQHLSTSDMPEPELVIRTGGEERLSNFLLWQSAYSELYFTDKYWPDFGKAEFRAAIADFQGRERRYGKTGDQILEELKLF